MEAVIKTLTREIKSLEIEKARIFSSAEKTEDQSENMNAITKINKALGEHQRFIRIAELSRHDERTINMIGK